MLKAQIPTISDFAPKSGKVGTAVTITGSNFNTIAANNIVYFGATKAVVTSATTTSLFVLVPVGASYEPLTVLNTTTHLMALSAKSFNVTFSCGEISPTSLLPYDAIIACGAFAATFGDLDGDGKVDMVFVLDVGLGQWIMSIYRNNSTDGSIIKSSFSDKVDFTIAGNKAYGPYKLALGDIDGDGKLDIVVVNTLGYVSVFRNASTMGSITTNSFASNVDFLTGSQSTDVSLADIDKDGKIDIAVSNSFNSTVSILRNTSTIGTITTSSFASKVDFAIGNNPTRLVLGDMDGDGRVDMVVTNNSNDSVSVFRNTSISGTITLSSFAPRISYKTIHSPLNKKDISLADLDGDGKLDIVVSGNSDSISIFRNTSIIGVISTNSFASQIYISKGVGVSQIAIGDLDGDGKPDIITNSTYYTISIFKNISTSGSITTNSFANKVDFNVSGTSRPYLFDLNGDGKSDIVIANNCFKVLWNIGGFNNSNSIAQLSKSNNKICDSLNIFTSTSSSFYIWFKDEKYLCYSTINNLFIKDAGVYQVKCFNNLICKYDTSNRIKIERFDDEKTLPKICAVSVDSISGKNEVIWEKSGINRAQHYNVYRENTSSQFVLIGTKLSNQFSTLLDTSSNPFQQSYNYKITLTDSCGSESLLDSSTAHKTIHLSANVGINSEVNLIWNLYEGRNYSSHNVMRSNNGGSFIQIAQVANNITSFTDVTPPSGSKIYRVDLANTSCVPTAKTNYGGISSNAVLLTPNGINPKSYDKVSITPNPGLEVVKIKFGMPIQKVEITNLSGITVFTGNYEQFNDVKINISSFNVGIYFLKINDLYIYKLIKI